MKKIYLVCLAEGEEWSAQVAVAFTDKAKAETDASERNDGYGYWYVSTVELLA